MSILSSYTPFLIGKSTTGQFQYLQPWQRAEDAFDPMINVFSYRGSLYKRSGYQELGHTGLLRYCNNEIADLGDGGFLYAGTLSAPIAAGSLIVTVLTSGGLETFSDDGLGVLTGSLFGNGFIDYVTGIWSISTGANTVAVSIPIVIQYTFTPSLTSVVIAIGDGVTSSFSGTLSNIPLVPNSLTLTAVTNAGSRSAYDDGYGWFSGDLPDYDPNINPSTIDYITGDWLLNTSSPIANGENLIATYVKVGDGSPIMGINVWVNETNNSDTMTVEDQKRMAIYNPNTKLFDPICTIDEDFKFATVVAGGAGPFLINSDFINLSPYSVTISNSSGDSMTDAGDGTFPGSGNLANTTTVNYTTGVITLQLVAGQVDTYSIAASLQGDYFTSGNTNFFNFVNWKPNDTLPGLLYLTNNKDRITTFDGTNLARPNFIIRQQDLATLTNGISTTSSLKVYKNRLLMFRPTVLFPSTVIEAQIVRYSSQFYTFGVNTVIPYDFIADVAGHGGVSEAPTPDWIISEEFLRDVIIVFMQKSTWIFRFTGSSFDPFAWQQLNSSRTTNAVYGSIDYDNNCTAMGSKGLISCDGTNVDRYDIAVIDKFEDIDNDNFIQCIAQRDDIMNQSWMIYPSKSDRPSSNHFSDKAIIYNFLENTFASYAINLSFVGQANTFEDITWASFAAGSGSWVQGKTWRQCNFPWNNGLTQNLAPTIYGGDQNGYVYTLNVTETDNGTHIDTVLTSKRWNPFIQDGQRCRFGYIDIYYEINPDTTLIIEIFVNNSEAPTMTKQLVLDGPETDDYAWKRLQVNMQGEFIRINITTPILDLQPPDVDGQTDRNDGSFIIPGIILWAAPAGRLVPGGFA